MEHLRHCTHTRNTQGSNLGVQGVWLSVEYFSHPPLLGRTLVRWIHNGVKITKLHKDTQYTYIYSNQIWDINLAPRGHRLLFLKRKLLSRRQPKCPLGVTRRGPIQVTGHSHTQVSVHSQIWFTMQSNRVHYAQSNRVLLVATV